MTEDMRREYHVALARAEAAEDEVRTLATAAMCVARLGAKHRGRVLMAGLDEANEYDGALMALRNVLARPSVKALLEKKK